jgi:hypothetical protein
VSRRIVSGLRSYLPEDVRERIPEVSSNSHNGFLGRIFRRSAVASNSNA